MYPGVGGERAPKPAIGTVREISLDFPPATTRSGT
jgi:hypothetical protein